VEALEAERCMDYSRGIAYDLKFLADVCSILKDFDRADMCIRESRELFRSMKDKRGELDAKRTEAFIACVGAIKRELYRYCLRHLRRQKNAGIC
jgi:hypothetical protein